MFSDDLSQKASGIWNRNAAFWDDYFKEGNAFHRYLVSPAVEKLLELQPGEQVLDVACGNGALARRLADLGAKVTACDVSPVFIERARARSADYSGRVEYTVADASREEALLSLGEGKFDAATNTMALMDMAQIDPLFRALARLVRPGGRFVFVVAHPCFNSSGAYKAIEEADRDGELVVTSTIKVEKYITPFSSLGLGIIGQPEAQYYFHRPLNVLFGAAFRAGWMIDGIEEPTFPPELEGRRPFSWEAFKEIPPVLAVRCRRPLA
ncbi:protein containg methyltransferase domain [Longilinea arvoryzae]|uniref:Protein containg methyltransferase domain n=1 Tax=Longilinea arvoryzae TaxID=360412 RepID=A0A0S7B5D4_9CHLR|nr:class I SAM-dependent methyltransferase [Longilinea arvoryzae]GAP12364.1 protein containg methyltransferase domain [Longilinea arvoryzae]